VIHLRDKRDQEEAYTCALAVLSEWVSGMRRLGDGRALSPGVLHCFSGTLEVARAALDLGFCIGVDGPVTFPNAQGLRALVADLPLDRLLLETDCPYLAPQARRGKRNEPAFLPYIGAQVAELHGVDQCAVASTTTANAEALFGIAPLNQHEC
jgi:TatD DNase family protein